MADGNAYEFRVTREAQANEYVNVRSLVQSLKRTLTSWNTSTSVKKQLGKRVDK